MREMVKNLPKYVSLKRSSYHYQRQIPTRYQHISKSKYFTVPLGLKVGATEVELATAAQQAGDEFGRFCRLLSVSDPVVSERTRYREFSACIAEATRSIAGQSRKGPL